MKEETLAEWMASDEGLAYELGVYKDGFDEGWENARALEFFVMPDEEIPTTSYIPTIWKPDELEALSDEID